MLAELLHRGGYRFEIAHCNFHLRSNESDRDERFVRQMAERYGVECHVAQFDTEDYAAEKKISTEMAARELRYEWFEKVRQERELDLIAVAHHRDDAIETFFINLLRGAGLSGLCGMKEQNGKVVRPLLHVSREEIDRYITENKLDYVDDSTNASDLYLRNRIRHQLLPLLRELNPSFDSVMEQNLHNLSDSNEIYQAAVSQLRNSSITHRSDGIDEIEIRTIDNLTPQTTILFELLRPYGFNSTTTSEIANGLHSESGRMYLSPTHRLIKDRHTLQVSPLEITDVPTKVIISEPIARKELTTLKTERDTILCDAATIQQPLTLRHWHDGDRFQPFGMKGSRLVSDYFSDLKLSIIEKQQQWLLCDADGEIVWLVGMRADGRFAITDKTEDVVRIKVVRGQ